jgi:hypothetical protein
MGEEGLDPQTSCVKGRRANKLSYSPGAETEPVASSQNCERYEHAVPDHEQNRGERFAPTREVGEAGEQH